MNTLSTRTRSAEEIFAEYFYRLTPTKESKERWKEYKEYAVELVEKPIKKQEEIGQKKRELLRAAQKSDDKGRIDELERALARLRQELASLRSQPSLAEEEWAGGILTSDQAFILLEHYGYISISGTEETIPVAEFNRAVKLFQIDEGLTVDGYLGPETAKALKEKALRDGVALERKRESSKTK